MFEKDRKKQSTEVSVPGHTRYAGIVTADYCMPECLEEYEKNAENFWNSFFEKITVDVYCGNYANGVLNGLEDQAARELERQRVERRNAMNNIILQYKGDLVKLQEELKNIEAEIAKTEKEIVNYTEIYEKYNFW